MNIGPMIGVPIEMKIGVPYPSGQLHSEAGSLEADNFVDKRKKTTRVFDVLREYLEMKPLMRDNECCSLVVRLCSFSL